MWKFVQLCECFHNTFRITCVHICLLLCLPSILLLMFGSRVFIFCEDYNSSRNRSIFNRQQVWATQSWHRVLPNHFERTNICENVIQYWCLMRFMSVILPCAFYGCDVSLWSIPWSRLSPRGCVEYSTIFLFTCCYIFWKFHSSRRACRWSLYIMSSAMSRIDYILRFVSEFQEAWTIRHQRLFQ